MVDNPILTVILVDYQKEKAKSESTFDSILFFCQLGFKLFFSKNCQLMKYLIHVSNIILAAAAADGDYDGEDDDNNYVDDDDDFDCDQDYGY